MVITINCDQSRCTFWKCSICNHPHPDISNLPNALCHSLTIALEPEPEPELPPEDRREFCVFFGWNKAEGYGKCYNDKIPLTDGKPICIGIKCGQYLRVDPDTTIKDIKL
jgi:hypothetical protein